ncbi:MAG: GSCFA domain-containing protein [Bacteroidia bacterium]
MNFKIEFPISAPDSLLNFESKYFFAGSCFAENISLKMKELQMNQEFLTQGILFNPISLCQAFKQIIGEEKPDENSILEAKGLFFSWNHHGKIFHTNKSSFIDLLHRKNIEQSVLLRQSNYLIVSFGSAYVYELIEQNRIVANCHKVPASAFRKRLLSVHEIVNAWSEIIHEIQKMNPCLRIIFTVSPVKYLKDGIHENNLSKSTLLLAVEELRKMNQCMYFPAYEIQTDELRDYRFYAQDLAHPNQSAIDYIWERFKDSYFDEDSKQALTELTQYAQMKAHRVLHEGSEEHLMFKEKLNKKERELKVKYPFLNWS